MNIADQPYCATIQPINGPSRKVPMDPTPIIIKNEILIFHFPLSLLGKEIYIIRYMFVTFQYLGYLSILKEKNKKGESEKANAHKHRLSPLDSC